MPTVRAPKLLPLFLSRKLIEAKWPGIQLDLQNKTVGCPEGQILEYSNGTYTLKFWYFLSDKRKYVEREKFGSIKFSESFDIRKLLYFRKSGNYTLSREPLFKNIVNPKNKNIESIVVTTGSQLIFRNNSLHIGARTFKKVLREANEIYSKAKSYQKSTERYLSGLKSTQYSNFQINKTTHIEQDEFKFLISRLNLETKKKKSDFQKYLSLEDLNAIEKLTTSLLNNEVLSEDFLRRLNDYFIKERLVDIINVGKRILDLRSTHVNTVPALEIIGYLNSGEIKALEALWQKYFEKYLLYLIFTYKKIFPKVELENIDGDKKYPDFIGINHYNGLDVIEIKTHLKKVLSWDNSHKNFFFTPEMSKAIVQTINYMDSIVRERFRKPDDMENITQFTDKENLYHPRGIIVISSYKELTSSKEHKEELTRDFTKLRNNIQNIEIITFDEILGIAQEYIRNIVNN